MYPTKRMHSIFNRFLRVEPFADFSWYVPYYYSSLCIVLINTHAFL
jgi:hypothetical protein